MQATLQYQEKPSSQANTAVLLSRPETISTYCQDAREVAYVERMMEEKANLITLNQYERQLYFVIPAEHANAQVRLEKIRRAGHDLFKAVQAAKLTDIQLVTDAGQAPELLALAEGLALSSYEFLKYKSEKKGNTLRTIHLSGPGLSAETVAELTHLVDATFVARDLVNEPVIYLTAEQLSKEIIQLGERSGFKVEVFNKSKIKSLKMGGLLAVNAGSPNPPTFTIMEYKPAGARNTQPYILVGKGVVYDTGGLSLKPTANSMDQMKCDMAGAAAVAGTMYALACNQVPLYVVGLIPATENRPDGNAITPGDVITMYSGKTVEILNTDAEGRLILADALCYARKYDPQLVIDLATLTGSAARAIGKEGIVYMGTAPEAVKTAFEQSGNQVYERLVEFPLWDEYDEQIKSDIADLKNLGGPDAGAITAGKFLEHFTGYPWLHLDIAGGAFLTGPDNYRGKNGTGIGVRLLYHFLKSRAGS